MIFEVDKSWTLFLDRDGVINKRKIDGYIEEVDEFDFLENVLDAMIIAQKKFNRIVVVTNQQGIGKGIMTEGQLDVVHAFMQQNVMEVGGRIDRCYHASALEKENSPLRKPNPGMGMLAKKEFPEIDFSKSIMVGDSDSDIEFGIHLGMKTVRIGGENKNPEADLHVDSLFNFMKQL